MQPNQHQLQKLLMEQMQNQQPYPEPSPLFPERSWDHLYRPNLGGWTGGVVHLQSTGTTATLSTSDLLKR